MQAEGARHQDRVEDGVQKLASRGMPGYGEQAVRHLISDTVGKLPVCGSLERGHL